MPVAYVEAQIAVLTSGNMATSLQMQLNETILSPQGLLTTLQQNGLAVTNIILRSLDVEQVGRMSRQWSLIMLAQCSLIHYMYMVCA